jgi:hypothetical protein
MERVSNADQFRVLVQRLYSKLVLFLQPIR